MPAGLHPADGLNRLRADMRIPSHSLSSKPALDAIFEARSFRSAQRRLRGAAEKLRIPKRAFDLKSFQSAAGSPRPKTGNIRTAFSRSSPRPRGYTDEVIMPHPNRCRIARQLRNALGVPPVGPDAPTAKLSSIAMRLRVYDGLEQLPRRGRDQKTLASGQRRAVMSPQADRRTAGVGGGGATT